MGGKRPPLPDPTFDTLKGQHQLQRDDDVSRINTVRRLRQFGADVLPRQFLACLFRQAAEQIAHVG